MSTTTTNPSKKTAGGDNGFATVSQRRLKYGTNVLVMCLAALAIVVILNVISFAKHYRKDMAVAGAYQPSERSKRIVDALKSPITLTSVYTGRDEENHRDKYYPAVEDYLRELSLYAPSKVKVAHVSTDARKAELLTRIRGKYSGQAKEYQALIDAFGTFGASLKSQEAATATQPALQQDLLQITAALSNETAFLAGFPQVADLQAKLNKNLQSITDTQDEVKRLTKGTGMPRYSEARDKISQQLDQLKETVTAGQKDLQSIAALAAAGTDPFFHDAPERMKQLAQTVLAVQATIGDAKDPNLPADLRGALQAFARETQKASIWLNEEATRQEELAKKYPALAEMPNWLAKLRSGIIEEVISLPQMVRRTADELTSLREQIRQVLAKQDIPQDRVADAVRKLRGFVGTHVQFAHAVSQQVGKVRETLANVDTTSQAVLEQAKGGQWQSGLIGKIDEIKAQITRLPELKLSEVSDKLETPNAIIAEGTDKVEVIPFDDVWPQSESMRNMPQAEAPRRAFNGDAITASLLGLSQPPVATVIFTHFVGEVPPQMRQFMPPQAGSIPYEQLSTLRTQLTKANFVVKEWNMAKEPNAPEPQKDTKAIYVFLPPPQDMPMPGPRDEKGKFGDAQLAKVKEIVDGGAPSIFLCKWEPPARANMFMPPADPKYAYEDLLKEKFGVEVGYKFRTVYGVPEQRSPGFYGVNVQRWGYMPLNDFSDMAIGKPLQRRRVLMLDVCPVTQTAEAAKDVKVEPILSVSKRDEYWAAADVMKLVQQVVGDREKGGLVSKQPGDKMSPFTIALAVKSAKGDPKAVVLGTGGSVLDGYLGERVPRIGGKNDRLSFDPPPTANADLVINSVLWLAGRADLIGEGPVVLPPVGKITDGQMALIRGLVWVLLPALVLAAGGAVFAVRRR